MDILYAEKAEKQLKRTAKGNRNAAVTIINAIESYAANPGGVFDIKLLKGRYGEFKRLRVGN